MTDGPTGFHVAPITEDDMFKVKDILQRAADAIVGMSQLSADVDMLRQTVSGLQADTERLRSQNNALDEALNYSRGERDRLATELTNVKIDREQAQGEAKQFMETVSKLDMDNGQLQIDLDLTRKAKDEAEFHNLELEDKLKAAEAKLAKVAELHRALFPPEPVAEAKPEVGGVPMSIPPLQSDELPTSVASALTDHGPDSLTAWEPGYTWDHDTGKYWRNGVEPKRGPDDLSF